MHTYTMAALQMVSGSAVEANLHVAARLIAQAAEVGAQLVVLPENFAFMGQREVDKLAVAEREGIGPIQAFLADQAARHNLWVVGGTMPLRADAVDKVRASCLVFDNTGQRVARYDKLHLFDVALPEVDERYCESESIEPGDRAVVVDTPFGGLGLAVCYDLRFPELTRRLLDQGLEILALPAAFTAATGKAHWEVLLRARAVENLCYIVAAAQGGRHENGRETYGDSMIIDPWGVILNRLAHGPGVVLAQIEQKRLEKLRHTFPVLSHRRGDLQNP